MFEITIQHFEEIDSTSSYLKVLSAEGAREGLVITAEYQTGGRGKPGSKWISPKGENLLFSLLIRPPINSSKAPIITQIACRSVAAVLKNLFDIESTFKNPNDILVGGKKICGVLTEAVSSSEGPVEAVIIGVGLNLNSLPEQLIKTATSVRAVTGKPVDRKDVLNAVLEQLQKDLKPLYA